METIQIKKLDAYKAYEEADSKVKKVLATLFGDQIPPKKITDRVKSFEDALAICPASENVSLLLKYNGIDKHMLSIVAFTKLSIIAKALNENWEPDWTNSSEYKYYPYFRYKAGFGFSGTAYDGWFAGTLVGSRLCFKTSELAEYAAKQFESLYNDFLSI